MVSTEVTEVSSPSPVGPPPVPGSGSGSGAGNRTRRTVDRLRGAPDWLTAIGVGLLAALIGVIPQWRGTFFYYIGDNVESFIPLWHRFGTALRAGEWPGFAPAAWAGGNSVGEAAYGIFNPVTLANAVLVSHFDDLSLAAAVVMVQFLGLLAAGVYLLARGYGAHRGPAVLVAIAVPFSGFTLWYEAAGWPAGLMAFTWVTHFWWSARRHACGRTGPIVPFVFGALAMTTGNPYAALGLVLVLTGLGVELLVQRRYARLVHLAVVGACVGSLALLVFLPLLGAGPVTDRQQLAAIANDTFFVPDLGDLAAASSPTYLPSILNWNGALLEQLPSTYLAWFVLPLLPWLRWADLRTRRLSLTSLGVTGGAYLLATLGPSNLWLFRWPLRLIEYLYLVVAVLFAVALSAGLATDRVRGRGVASAAIVALGGYLSWAVQPGMHRLHLAGVVGVGVLVALTVLAWSRYRMPGLVAVVLVGTVGVVFLQTTVFPPGPDAPGAPHDLSELRSGASVYEGTVLQLAGLAGVTTDQTSDDELLFGNLPRVAGVESVGAYTGIGFREFTSELCLDYRGGTCPEALDRLWEPAGDGVPVPLVDAMGVSTVVLQRSMFPAQAGAEPPPGWEVAERTDVRTVWVREEPLDGDGRVTWASAGVEVLGASAEPRREEVRYRADGDGRVLFARLAWPGYAATVDGQEVDVIDGPAGLLLAEVPEGAGTLVLTYRPPGLALGAAVAGVAGLVILGQAVVWHRQRRRSAA